MTQLAEVRDCTVCGLLKLNFLDNQDLKDLVQSWGGGEHSLRHHTCLPIVTSYMRLQLEAVAVTREIEVDWLGVFLYG